MDLFKYTAEVAHINALTKVKEVEEYVRKYSSELSNTAVGNRCWMSNGMNSITQILTYKLTRLSYAKHCEISKAKLPDFIFSTLKVAQHSILESCLANKLDDDFYNQLNLINTPNYSEFMDIFEFDTELSLPNSSYYIESLNSIIDSNPIHFTINFNYNLANFDRYSTVTYTPAQKLIYAIRYKQVNFPRNKQTVWDLFINECKSNCKYSISGDHTTKLKQQIKAVDVVQKLLVDLPPE